MQNQTYWLVNILKKIKGKPINHITLLFGMALFSLIPSFNIIFLSLYQSIAMPFSLLACIMILTVHRAQNMDVREFVVKNTIIAGAVCGLSISATYQIIDYVFFYNQLKTSLMMIVFHVIFIVFNVLNKIPELHNVVKFGPKIESWHKSDIIKIK